MFQFQLFPPRLFQNSLQNNQCKNYHSPFFIVPQNYKISMV